VAGNRALGQLLALSVTVLASTGSLADGPEDVTIAACLAAVAEEAGNADVSFLSKDYSEANSAIMVGIGLEKAAWRCLVSNDGIVAELTPPPLS
jgi:hypothetical protein